jgi:2,4-dienoyl-CoA reductase-like NADH-dependent reductase (Old Yellow Enzyme family)
MDGLYNWDDLDEMLEYLIPKLDTLGLRQLDISCANANYYETSGQVIRKVRKLWPHFLMGGASLTHEQAIKEVESGLLDMVTWGRHVLANPDFVSKLKNEKPITEMTNEMRNVLY